jgi:Flp pilus assembly protein TadG
MSIFQRLCRFGKNESGNIALLFALGVGPLLVGAGVAIDYSRASNARTAVFAAADAAAIAGASTRGTPAQRETAARQVFQSNLESAGITTPVTVHYRNLTTGPNNTGYRVEASTSVRSLLGSFTGSSEKEIATTSQANSGMDEPTEVAFVLDTTDSMEGDRIATLKSATTSMIDELVRRAVRPDLVKVGVVPFSQYVNVGMGRRTAPWIDVRSDYQTPVITTCSMERVQVGETNCRMVNYGAESSTPATPCMRDGRARMCGGNPGRGPRTERVCDPIMSATPQNVCRSSGGDWVRWEGCVGSRAYPLETQDARYDIKIPGVLGVTCGTPLVDLTTDLARVRSTISALETNGETYLPSGLIWGWRMLSAGEPLSLAAPATTGVRKFMVFVTDGRNTKSPNYPAHEDGDSVMADRLTRETCLNISRDTSNKIRIFTIAFEVDGLESKTILQECASRTGGQFFDATNAAGLRESFSKVLEAIATVRLTQ